MPRTRLTGRRVRRSLLALLAATAVLLGAGLATAGPAAAAPSPNAPDEGDSKQLRAALEAAAKGHIDAQNKLDNSKRRQEALAVQIKDIEARLVGLTAQAGEVAVQSYRQGRLTPVSMLLASSGPDDFLHRAAELDMMAQRDSKRLGDLADREGAGRRVEAGPRRRGAGAGEAGRRAGPEEEGRRGGAGEGQLRCRLRLQRRLLVGQAGPAQLGRVVAVGVLLGGRPDAGQRLHHAAHAAHAPAGQGGRASRGYASCHRSGGGGEHPKGRACDFSAASGGFEDRSATGGDKAYGDAWPAGRRTTRTGSASCT